MIIPSFLQSDYLKVIPVSLCIMSIKRRSYLDRYGTQLFIVSGNKILTRLVSVALNDIFIYSKDIIIL